MVATTSQWCRRPLVKAYEVKGGHGVLAVQKLCDPCLSASEVEHFTRGAIQMFCYLTLPYLKHGRSSVSLRKKWVVAEYVVQW